MYSKTSDDNINIIRKSIIESSLSSKLEVQDVKPVNLDDLSKVRVGLNLSKIKDVFKKDWIIQDDKGNKMSASEGCTGGGECEECCQINTLDDWFIPEMYESKDNVLLKANLNDKCNTAYNSFFVGNRDNAVYLGCDILNTASFDTIHLSSYSILSTRENAGTEVIQAGYTNGFNLNDTVGLSKYFILGSVEDTGSDNIQAGYTNGFTVNNILDLSKYFIINTYTDNGDDNIQAGYDNNFTISNIFENSKYFTLSSNIDTGSDNIQAGYTNGFNLSDVIGNSKYFILGSVADSNYDDTESC